MRDVSVDFAAHIAATGGKALALCADITWTDETTKFGFTSWDRDIPNFVGFDVVYVASAGLTVSQVQANAGGAVDHLEIKLLPATAGIVEADIKAGKWNGSTINLFLINPENPTQGRLKLQSGTLGQVTIDRGVITAEFLGRLQHLLSTIGETVTSTCQNEFCGAVDSRGRGCGLDIADYTEAGEVTGWDGDGLVVDSVDLTGFADNYFNDGILTFDDEPWIAFGIRFFIQADGIAALKSAPPFAVTPGMAFTISRGCTKERDFCVDEYSNGPRFRGFPDLKGSDKLLQVGHHN